ncbi:MAG: DUF92 domain-containing protein [Rhodothermales bacterium]
MSDSLAFALFGSGLLVAVAMGEALRARAGLPPEASRRFVHAATGVLVALCPLWFSQPTGVYVLAGLFVVVNLWAIPRRVFPGMHGIQRRSWGTVTFPLALLFALVTCWTLDAGRVYILQTAFLILALSDPLASAVGMGLRRPGRFVVGSNEKSVAGSLAFFLSAFAVTMGALAVLGGHGLTVAGSLAAAFVVASLTTGAEALASRGWDNFFIVVAAVVPLTMLHGEPEAAGLLVAAVVVAVAFSGAAYAVGFLDRSGALATAGLAFSVVVLGPAWAVPGVTFFVLSSLLSKLGRRRKAQAEKLAEKGSRRDAGQVYANGGVAWALLIAYVFVPVDALYWGYVGAFAAAAADTWGTEIGTLAQGPTRLIWSGRRVPPGTSGGVSLAGTLGALAGATVVFLSVLPVGGVRLDGVGVAAAALVIVGGGMAAALVDSLLGATAQALYRDASGQLTERSDSNALVRGWRWLTNDRVNLACTLTGALLPAAFIALR